MWKCEKCGEKFDDASRTCWLCGTRRRDDQNASAPKNIKPGVPVKKKNAKGIMLILSLALVVFILGWFIISNGEDLIPAFNFIKEAFKQDEKVVDEPAAQDITARSGNAKNSAAHSSEKTLTVPKTGIPAASSDPGAPAAVPAGDTLRFGKDLMSRGLFDAAIEEFSKVIRNNPSYDAYYNRGCAYKALGRFDDALEDFKSAGRLKTAG